MKTGEWYYQLMGEVVGPLSADELRSHAAEGEIERNTIIRKGQNGAWVLADTVRGLFDSENRARDRQPESATPLPSEAIKFKEIQEVEPPVQVFKPVGSAQLQTPAYYHKICTRFQNLGYICAIIGGVGVFWGTFMVWFPEIRIAGVAIIGIGIVSAFGSRLYAWTWEVVSGYFDLEQQNLDLLRELVANTRRTTTPGTGKK